MATDGEYRRMFWHYDFYDGLDDVEIYEMDHGIQFQACRPSRREFVSRQDRLQQSPDAEHFKFVKQHTKVMPKMCIPSPTVLHFRWSRTPSSTRDLSNNDAIFSDLSAAYRKAVKAFYDAAAATCNSTTPPGPICAPTSR